MLRLASNVSLKYFERIWISSKCFVHSRVGAENQSLRISLKPGNS